MGYSRNFGMRSFENVVRDGRFRVPATGTPFKIGAPVMLDAANAGRLKAATAAVTPSQNCGIVVYEHIQNKSDALTTTSDSPYNVVPLGQYAQMMHGPGAKVWFRTTADKTLYGGTVQAGDTLLAAGIADMTGLAIGDGLTPDGAGKWRESTGAEVVWLVIEQVNPTTKLVEARFTF
jgi:hypothetical protein